MFITAKIDFIFTSLTAVQIYDFHIFTTVYSPLHGFIWNQHSWLVSSVGRALHRYPRGYGFKSLPAWIFFRPSFYYYLSSVHYCEDRFHIQEMLLFAHLEKQLHGKDRLWEIRPTQRSVIARQQNMTSDGGRREETELSHLTRETKNRTSQYWSHNAIKAYNFLGKAQNRSRKVDKRDTSTWISFTLFKSRFPSLL